MARRHSTHEHRSAAEFAGIERMLALPLHDSSRFVQAAAQAGRASLRSTP